MPSPTIQPPHKKNLKDRLKEGGNVLFIILLCVALFAALAYTVTGSTRSSGGDAKKESVSAQAADLMNYFVAMDTGIQRMMLSNDVKDYEVNFFYQWGSNLILGSQDNSNCTESRCRVFDPAGGGVIGRPLENYTRGNYSNPERIIYASIPNTGTPAPDVVFLFHGSSKELCEEINRRGGYNGVIYNVGAPETTQTLMYQFALPVGPIPDLGLTMPTPPTSAEQDAIKSGTFCTCHYSTWSACEASVFRPNIYHVLIAR